jgi:hypothetical protein
MRQAALDYVHLGSFPAEPAPQTLLTDRINKAAQDINYYPGRELRPGTPEFPSNEILLRLSHSGAIASFMHYLSTPRFARRCIANFTTFRTFWPSLIMNYNLDGLATDTCGVHHHVINVHGSIPAGYGGPGGAEMMRTAQEYGIEIPHQDLVLCTPESFADERLYRKLQVTLRFDPAFVMFVGYSFGKNDTGYDDDVSLETFIGRFRGLPLDVYVLEPRPFDLADMLRERLQSKRVHPFPVYWNLVAAAFTEVLSARLSAEHLEYFHEQLLDDSGPHVTFPR